jgi:hypothetical protein
MKNTFEKPNTKLMPSIRFIIPVILLLTSCATTYRRTTNMPHLKTCQEIVLKPHKKEIKLITRDNHTSDIVRDTTIPYVTGISFESGKDNDSIYMLEGGKVIFYRKSYWVNKKLDPEIREKYTNQDLNF